MISNLAWIELSIVCISTMYNFNWHHYWLLNYEEILITFRGCQKTMSSPEHLDFFVFNMVFVVGPKLWYTWSLMHRLPTQHNRKYLYHYSTIAMSVPLRWYVENVKNVSSRTYDTVFHFYAHKWNTIWYGIPFLRP